MFLEFRELSFAKTPQHLNVSTIACYTTALYVIEFKWALYFGEEVCPGKVGMFLSAADWPSFVETVWPKCEAAALFQSSSYREIAVHVVYDLYSHAV